MIPFCKSILSLFCLFVNFVNLILQFFIFYSFLKFIISFLRKIILSIEKSAKKTCRKSKISCGFSYFRYNIYWE